MHSAACFLNPSNCPGRTVICALTSKVAIGPPHVRFPGMGHNAPRLLHTPRRRADWPAIGQAAVAGCERSVQHAIKARKNPRDVRNIPRDNDDHRGFGRLFWRWEMSRMILVASFATLLAMSAVWT